MDNKLMAKELVKISKKISAASEIDYEQLPDDRKKLIMKLDVENKVDKVWEGIHGYIINLKDARLDKNDIKTLVADKNFRWIDASMGLTIGF